MSEPDPTAEDLRLVDRYRTLFEQSRDAIYVTDVDGRIADANPAMTELFGYDREEIVGLDARMLYADPEDRKRFRAEIEPTGTVKDFEVRLQRKDGASLACELTSTVYTDREDEVVGYQGIIRDVSERRQLVSLLESTLEATADGILAVDRGHRVRYYNRRFLDIWDISDEEMASGDRQGLLERVHGDVEPLEDGAEGAPGASPPTYPREESFDTLELDDGRIVQRHVRPRVLDGRIRGWVISFSDITESKRLERELEELAFHDSLTGLANRRLLREKAEAALALARREDRRTGLIFADLARFKRINDNLGHPAGDRALREVAERLRACLRDADVIARVGGDEFAVLLTRTDGVEGAVDAAHRLEGCFEEPFGIEGRTVHLDVRLGVAVFPDHAGTFDELFVRADRAMYQGREAPRASPAVWDPELEETHPASDLDREAHLRMALENGELAVHLQPIFGAGGREEAGYEALVRWRRSGGEVVPAGEFLHVAEESGLVREMDRWMLRAVTALLSRWQEQGGPGAWIAVNVSAHLLEDPEFPGFLRDLLRERGLEPGRLMLEVTERTTMTRPGRVASVLNEVHRLGVRIALDDFGTGHAVLANLKHFEFDVLKLDMVFVHRLGEEPRDAKLLEGITALGQELNMQVLAEGVESERQLRFVEEIGVDLVQGHLLGRPREADEVDAPGRARPGRGETG